MPYPFGAVSLGNFVQSVIERGGRVRELSTPIVGMKDGARQTYIELPTGNGHSRQVPLPDIADDEPLEPEVLTSMCRRLGIPKEEFGLTLDHGDG